ncbi:hypothetical protein HK098_003143 [Nowakowskiella sp. JEL0407]|nr:hypothetical protein HK098_003143 [Nowakowskiella sp. JEL0407]
MHCQQANSISDGVKQFQQILQRYPTALASRCFAFEPSETQADDTKGVIMIPNVGHLSFYLSTMINDFASELLSGFGNLAQQIEKKPIIHGPNFASPLSNTLQSTFNRSTNNLDLSSPARALSPPPMAQSIQSPSNSESDRGGSYVGLSFLTPIDKIKKRTPARIQKLLGDIYMLMGRHDLANSIFLSTIDIMKSNNDYLWQAAATESYFSTIFFFVIEKAGVVPQGPLSSIETGQETQDEEQLEEDDVLSPISAATSLSPPTMESVFHAGTIHSNLRNLLTDLPEKYREIVALYERATGAIPTGYVGGSIPPTTSTSPQTNSNQGAQFIYPILQISACLRLARYLYSMVQCRFTGIVANGAGFPLSPPDRTGIAEYASNMVGGTTLPRGTVDRSSAMSSVSSGTTVSGDRYVFLTGATKSDVSSWLMKAWSCGVEYLSVSDQVWCCSTIAAMYGELGYRRKHAYFLRMCSLLVVGTVKSELGVKRVGDGKRFGFDLSAVSGGGGRKSNGALECLKEACSVYGVGSKEIKPLKRQVTVSAPPSRRHSTTSVQTVSPTSPTKASYDSDDEDEWTQMYEDDGDIEEVIESTNDTKNEKFSKKSRVITPKVKFGWPEIQIDVLRRCIDVSLTLDDIPNTINFASRLLRRLYRHITADDQMEIAKLLQDIVVKVKSKEGNNKVIDFRNKFELQSAEVPLPVLLKKELGGVMGCPILRRLEVVSPTARKVPIPKPYSELMDGSESKIAVASGDPFIYNPYASNKLKGDVLLVAGETVFFDIILANPFAFELEISSITLKTSGIEFTPDPMQTIIPAECAIHPLRLSGTPIGSGTLTIHGCTVRILGGFIEEDVLFTTRKSKSVGTQKDKKDGKEKYAVSKVQSEKERVLGKKVVKNLVPSKKGQVETPTWTVPVQVIPPLPTLQMVDSSLGSDQALMLFEGEKTYVEMTLENIDKVPVNYLTITFADKSSTTDETNPETEFLEDSYERDVHERSIRAFWISQNGEENLIGSSKTVTINLEKEGGKLQCREKKTIVVGVFGKKGCIGGDITISYASVESLGLNKNSPLTRTSSTFEPDDELDFTSKPKSNVFYTRQLQIPILLTVQKSLEPLNMDILLFNKDSFNKSLNRAELAPTLSQQEIMFEGCGLEASFNELSMEKASDYCLFTFDLKNNWSQPFEVEFEVSEDKDSKQTSSTTIIHSGNTKRIILPIKRIHMSFDELHQPIPKPQWKQFVVGKLAQLTAQEELSRRSSFWLKEALIGGLNRSGRLTARWNCTNRSGEFSLRSLKLSKSSAKVLLAEEIEFSVNAIPRKVSDLKNNEFSFKVGEVIDLEWTIQNLTDIPAKLCLRVFPTQDLENGEIQDDVTGKLVYQGALQTLLPEILPSGTVKHKIPVLFLSSGRYKFLYHAEDAKIGAAMKAINRVAAEAQREAKQKKSEYVDVAGRVGEVAKNFLSERMYGVGKEFVISVEN